MNHNDFLHHTILIGFQPHYSSYSKVFFKKSQKRERKPKEMQKKNVLKCCDSSLMRLLMLKVINIILIKHVARIN